MKQVIFRDLGRVSYKEAWDYQEELFQSVIDQKVRNRRSSLPESTLPIPHNHLLFCEHNHVYTLGKSGDDANLILPTQLLEARGIEYFHINRGGDITYHGPGQIVVYPIFDLDQFFTDIHRYLRTLEEAVILMLEEFGVKAGRVKEYTGVWIDPEKPEKARKICAMGVKCSRWVTMHGIALNVNTDLSYFGGIVPCGIQDHGVTSMQTELDQSVDLNDAKAVLLEKLKACFDFHWSEI